MLILMIAIAMGLIVVERLWPATELPKVRAWWWRVAFVNLIQLGIVIVAGLTWDRLFQRASVLHFGTFENGREGSKTRCGYDDWREDRFEDILAFRDVHAPHAAQISALHFLPTCIGCKKKWACTEARERVGSKGDTSS